MIRHTHDEVKTTTAAGVLIATLPQRDLSAGVIDVRAVGFNGEEMTSRWVVARFKVVGGSAAVTGIVDLAPQEEGAALVGSLIEVDTFEQDITVKVYGVDGQEIDWVIDYSLTVIEQEEEAT